MSWPTDAPFTKTAGRLRALNTVAELAVAVGRAVAGEPVPTDTVSSCSSPTGHASPYSGSVAITTTTTLQRPLQRLTSKPT
jgi:hypothetical protein